MTENRWRVHVRTGPEYMRGSETTRSNDYGTQGAAEARIEEEIARYKAEGYTLWRHELRTANTYVLHLTKPQKEPDGSRPFVTFSWHRIAPYRGEWIDPLPNNPDFRL